jgi:hypothetical protein
MARLLNRALQSLPAAGIAVQEKHGGGGHDWRESFWLDQWGPVRIVILRQS